MEHRGTDAAWAPAPHSRFELAPPRRFLLPAVLLLLSEEPAYGYHLAKGLEELRFGRVDRPSVYRALAQLERDGLVEAWSDPPKAGQARRVYGLTEDGQRALRAWMGVVKQERDCLDLVLRRYVATGTIDAALAEAEGGWAAVTGHPWSPVSSTSRIERRRAHLRPTPPLGCACDEDLPGVGPSAMAAVFSVDPDRSVVLIEARSSVGPITFGAVGVTGHIEASVLDGVVKADSVRSAHLEIDVGQLRSGNALYDAELLRRIDARRHPTVSLELRTCRPAGGAGRYHVDGEITFHGSTRVLDGTVGVNVTPAGKLVVSGEQVVDIRDFDIDSPTVLMLRIYPDVAVQLHIEAVPGPLPVPTET
jgi:DNA-binding PadR family transcriptional regulator/polyisoprenoid-binding protein YceI